MSQIHAESSRVIGARPEDVYAVLSDYREGHPAILPKQYFTELTVEEGGQGAGTVFRMSMKVMGVESRSRMFVTEPEPGRVLAEANEELSVFTTFTFDPINSGSRTRLTIATDLRLSSGLKGFFEKLFFPSILRRIYKKELALIADYMRAKSG